MTKNYYALFIACFLIGVVPACAANSQQEIVIEMVGPQTKKRPEQSIWDKNARQLTKLFRGKNKKQVLETVDAISAQEQTLSSSTGEVYQLIQYGQDTRNYRKFLFENSAPYPFVTCAANAEDIIAVFQRYGVNMGLRKKDFLISYPKLENPTPLTDKTTSLLVYTLPAKQLPLPADQPLFVVFEENHLVQLLNGPDAFEAYKKTLQPSSTLQTQPETPRQSVTQPKTKKPYTALLSGGTTEDRMYRPRVIGGTFDTRTEKNKKQTNK